MRFYLSWFNLTSLIGLTPFNGPLWTVSVLIFMYAAFPFLLHRVKSVQNRLTWCLHNYWISVVSFTGLFYAGKVLGAAIKCNSVDYFLARGFPLGRLPVFMMGCLLGEDPSPPEIDDGWYALIDAAHALLSFTSTACPSSLVVDEFPYLE